MKQRKLLTSLFLAAALSISLLTGCGNTGSSTSETKHTENSATVPDKYLSDRIKADLLHPDSHQFHFPSVRL